MIFFKFSPGGLNFMQLQTAPTSSTSNPPQALRYVFQRSFCGSWRRMEGHGGGREQLEALSLLVWKNLPCTEGPTKYSMGELSAWGHDHRQLQVSMSHSIIPGATAGSKTCPAEHLLQAQSLLTHHARAGQSQNNVHFC